MKIETIYTLKQPLSHIGESESTSVFLNTISVVSENQVRDVFAYTGNAIRGAWRDCGAIYLLDKLGTKANKRMFQILFSGGNISGEQKADIDQAREIRELFPLISLMGAGIGNQILQGKMAQGFAYPVCEETKHIIPEGLRDVDYGMQDKSWKKMTGTIQFTHMDDEKRQVLADYQAAGEEAKDKDNPTQMRYEVEYLCPGTQLYHSIVVDCSDIEFGALMSCIYQWSKKPVLGGMSGKGFGLTDMGMWEKDGDTLVTVTDGKITLSEYAEERLAEYDAYIEEHKSEIMRYLA